MQGLNRKGITKAVVDILEVRKHTLKEFPIHRKGLLPLSEHAKTVLKTKT